MVMFSNSRFMIRLLFVGWLVGVAAAESAHGQEFENTAQLIEMMDGAQFEVPGYGVIEFNHVRQIDRTSLANPDEKQNVTFSTKIRRLEEKKWERTDYFSRFEVPSWMGDEVGRIDTDSPDSKYYLNFSINREVIYQIHDFPSIYVLFADGEVYFRNYIFSEHSFSEAKSLLLSNQLGLDTRTSWVHCPRIEN